jgi:hypothetical protein
VTHLLFILKGLLIASAAIGIKKASDAVGDSYAAVKLNRRAQEIFEAKRELPFVRIRRFHLSLGLCHPVI